MNNVDVNDLQRRDETNEFMQSNLNSQNEQVEYVKMEFLSSLMVEIKRLAVDVKSNIRDLRELTAKFLNFENLFKFTIKESIRKSEDGIKAKFDVQNGRHNDEIKDLSYKT